MSAIGYTGRLPPAKATAEVSSESRAERRAGSGCPKPPADTALSRRAVVLGSGAAFTAFSGCQTLVSDQQPRLDLSVSNYTDRDQPFNLTLLRESDSGSGDPVALDSSYMVPAPDADGETAGTLREPDLVPRRRYLVRVQLKYGGFDRMHAHFYPDESSEDVIDFRIRRDDKTEELFVDFRFL